MPAADAHAEHDRRERTDLAPRGSSAATDAARAFFFFCASSASAKGAKSSSNSSSVCGFTVELRRTHNASHIRLLAS